MQKFINQTQPYFEDLITRATYHSNSIEGNTLSMAETYAILFNKNDAKITAKPREIYEAINHKYALDYLFNNMSDDLTEKDIIYLACTINKNIDEIDGYRKGPVWIIGAEHIPPPANMVKQYMMQFVYNYNNTNFTDVFEKVAHSHIEYERIHPFGDGNGRTGRILIWYELLKHNVPFPIITVDNKIEYINLIANQDVKGLSRLLEDLSNKELERMKQFDNNNFFGNSIFDQNGNVIPYYSDGASVEMGE